MTASCGHIVDDFDALYHVSYETEDCNAVDGFHPCTMFMSICFTCYTKFKDELNLKIVEAPKELK